MANPSIPKVDAILDRIVAVLAAMVAGSTYWFTPAGVSKRFVHWREYTGQFPFYMVTLGSDGERILNSAPNIDETFQVTVKGYVKDNKDTAAKIARCIQDIRVALKNEMENGATGSLPSLGAIQCRNLKPAETDDGYLAIENGMGFFDLRFDVTYADTVGYI